MRDDARELITAYHDGELGPDASAQARRVLQSDPEAHAYYEALRRSDEILHRAFEPILSKPIPKGIDKVLKRLDHRHHYGRWVPMALAASVTLIAVLLIRQEQFDRQLNDQFAEMQQEIIQLRNQTLENTPSGISASWVTRSGGSRVEVTPVKSYRTKDNRYCREYEERITDTEGVEIRRGIACRTGKANWPDRPGLPSQKKEF